jgi:xanthine dehydrogenase YagS FAD-binding subunit
MNTFEWVNATSVADAIAHLGPNAEAKAGGVDLMDLMKERLIAPKRLVNLRTVPGLDRLTDAPGEGLRIGPMVTLARLAADPAVIKRYRALADAAGHAATPQIRNMATAGGNLVQRPRCWYFRQEEFHCRKKGGQHCFAQDGENAYHAIFENSLCAAVHPSALGTALVALGGVVELSSATGKREIALEKFFTKAETNVHKENILGMSELITEIRVPAPAHGASSAYMKLGEKESFDWPLVEAAVSLERAADGKVTFASLVLGAVAHHPYRARAAEAELKGKAVDDLSAAKAAKAALTGATPLAENGYKLHLVEVILRRTIIAAARGAA